jgi:L-asparaginase
MPGPRVTLVATGGTIAMTGSPAHPAVSAEELVAAVPGLAEVAQIEVEQLSNVPGANLHPAAAAQAIAAASRAVSEGGAAGAVIIQGTDTVEETSELADLVWGHDEPLAITGAIRTGGAAGADGPLNLLDAVLTVTSPASRGAGPLVVFDSVVHPAAEAVKSHSWRTDAFSSETPAGLVREGELQLECAPARPGRPVCTPEEAAAAALDAHVPIVAAAAGMDSRPLDALREQGAAAVVVISLGAGHLPATMLPGLDRALEAGLPVVLCARPERGGTLARTYGFEGSETDLARRGAILAGAASAWKARIRVLLALALGRTPATLFENEKGRLPAPLPEKS